MKYVCGKYLADSEQGAFEESNHNHELCPGCKVIAVVPVEKVEKAFPCFDDFDRDLNKWYFTLPFKTCQDWSTIRIVYEYVKQQILNRLKGSK